MAYGGAIDSAIDVWSEPFWDACREGRLTAQKCLTTGKFWFPPGPVSPFTRTPDWTWARLSGRGRVKSFIIMHQVYFMAFEDKVPYSIAQIELEEGAMMLSNLVEIDNDDIRIGMSVEVTFEVRNGLNTPLFKPAN